MKIKAVNGFARTLKSEGVPWVSCYPTSPVNNALGEEGVPILMMGEERFAVAVADGFSRVTCGKQIGVCTVMAGLNAAGIQMAYGAVAQAWEDSSPLLVIAEGVGPGATRHTHYDIGQAFKSVTKWVGEIDRAELVPDYVRRAFTHLRSGRPGPVLLLVPRDLGEYDEAEHPYAPVKGWRSGPDPDDVKTAVKVLPKHVAPGAITSSRRVDIDLGQNHGSRTSEGTIETRRRRQLHDSLRRLPLAM